MSNTKSDSDMFTSESMLNETERKIYTRIVGVFRHSKVPSPDKKENVIGVILCPSRDLQALVSRIDSRLNKDGLCLSQSVRHATIRRLLNLMNESEELVYRSGCWSIPALDEEASRKKKPKRTSRKEKRRRLNPLPA